MKRLLIIFLFIASNSFGTTLYFIGGSDWDNSAFNWSTSSGGASCTCTPTNSDDVVFDANSGSGTVNILAGATGKSLRADAFTGTFDVQSDFSLWGTSIVLGSGMSWTNSGNTYALNLTTGNGDVLLKTNGVTVGVSITVDENNDGSNDLILQDDLTMGADTYLKLTRGGLDMNGFDIVCGTFYSTSNSKTFTMGSSTFELTGVDAVSPFSKTWGIDDAGAITFDAGTSTIKFTASTTGEAITFDPDVVNNSTAHYYYYIQANVGSGCQFNFYGGGTETVYLQNLTTTSNNVLFNFTPSGVTSFAEEPVLSGTSGNLNTLSSSSDYYFYYGDTICWNYVDVSYLDATNVSGDVYAGCNSINGGNNTNVTFNNCGVACAGTIRKKSRFINSSN